jgi:GAF domain-containing protein
MNVNGLAWNGRADPWTVGLEEALGRVATLAAAALSAPSASVMSADARALPEISGVPGIDDQRSPFEQLLYAEVVGSRDKVIIGDTRLGRRRGNGDLSGPASVIAWAGVPVRDQDGHVAGVLWVADRKPRRWSTSDVAILEILAEVASSDVTLRAALAHSAERAALAQTLEESLLPPP